MHLLLEYALLLSVSHIVLLLLLIVGVYLLLHTLRVLIELLLHHCRRGKESVSRLEGRNCCLRNLKSLGLLITHTDDT